MSWSDQEQRIGHATLVTLSGPIASPITGPISTTQPTMRTPAVPSATYMIPDERMLSRTNFQHMMLQTAMGGNYLAPVEDPHYILDVGCGGGRWAYELAEQFPQTRVIGVDTVPLQNDAAISGIFEQPRPENLLFKQADVLVGLPFAASTFDFVHQRLLALAIPLQAWPRVTAELVRVTHPGGWVELVEGDLVRNGGPALDTLQQWITTLARKRGIDPRAGQRVGELLHSAGLHRIVAHDIELPVGSHGGRFGELMAEDFLARVEQLRAMIVSSGLTTAQEYDRFLAALAVEMTGYSYMQPFHVAYGQR